MAWCSVKKKRHRDRFTFTLRCFEEQFVEGSVLAELGNREAPEWKSSVLVLLDALAMFSLLTRPLLLSIPANPSSWVADA
jgi:hypothetical protein